MMIRVREAYGRKYKSKKEALDAWNKGKDFFSCTDGAYCSIRNFNEPLDTVYMFVNKQFLLLKEGLL